MPHCPCPTTLGRELSPVIAALTPGLRACTAVVPPGRFRPTRSSGMRRDLRPGRRLSGASPGETSCLTLAWAVMDLVIAGGRGLDLTLPERHQIAAIVAARSTPQTEERIA